MLPLSFERPGGAIEVRGRRPGFELITTLDEWHTFAPPMTADVHWREGYSAMEAAKAWLPRDGGPRVPAELTRLFETSEWTRGLRVATVLPEHGTPLGDGRAGPRRHDQILLGMAGGEKVVVGVETKTDEPFDDALYAAVGKAWRLLEPDKAAKQAQRTGKIERVQRLCRALFGRPLLRIEDGRVTSDEQLEDLPYQLIAGLAGTLREAASLGAARAAFVAHAFYPENIAESGVDREHHSGFQNLVRVLAGDKVDLVDQLHGPFSVPGGHGIDPIPVVVGVSHTTIERRPVRKPARASTVAARRKRYADALESDVVRRIVEAEAARVARPGGAAPNGGNPSTTV